MDTSFLEKLRMNNIFPAKGNPSQLINMPDMNSGRPNESYGGPPNRLQQIAQQQQIQYQPYVPPESYDYTGALQGGPPKDQIYKPVESDSYGTRILMGDTAKDKDRQLKENIALSKTGIDQGRLELAKKVQAGKATDAQKFQHAMDLENDRQEGRIDLQGLRGTQTTGQIDQRGNIQKDVLTQSGNQALERIQASINGKQSLQDSKPITASQVGSQQNNTIREIMLTKPYLSQYITQDTGGRFTIAPDAPMNAISEIQQALNPSKGLTPKADIELPSSSKSSTPVSTNKVITQRSPSTGKTRTSTDGGKTWTIK